MPNVSKKKVLPRLVRIPWCWWCTWSTFFTRARVGRALPSGTLGLPGISLGWVFFYYGVLHFYSHRLVFNMHVPGIVCGLSFYTTESCLERSDAVKNGVVKCTGTWEKQNVAMDVYDGAWWKFVSCVLLFLSCWVYPEWWWLHGRLQLQFRLTTAKDKETMSKR